MLLTAGVVFLGGAALLLADVRKAADPIEEGLPRNGYGEGSRREELRAALEGGIKTDLSVEVSEQAYPREQVQELFGRCTGLLDVVILGDNESPDHVDSNLNLVTAVPGEPVDVSWELDRYDVMNVRGELQKEALKEEGIMVNLRGTLTYRQDETQQALYECTVMVYPAVAGEEEAQRQRLEEIIQERDKQTQTEEALSLPETVGGKPVRYYRQTNLRGVTVMALALFTLVLLCLRERQEEQKKLQERKRQMLLDYPEIVSKLTLLLGAGMTVKRAWRKTVQDYEEIKPEWGERYAYEEMARAAREMESGVTESESYERFGRRCQVQEYIKLGALLSQNLRKGTRGLTQLLTAEAVQAFEERKARARRLGEEAGTKLLAPMFLMLAVVLLIVIVPAFLSIQL